jgi:CheY-like chemotaxis protein
MKVLVVDDDDVLRKAIVRVLKSSYKCETRDFDNGAAALEAVKLGPNEFDGVISDVDMPKMGGPEFFEALRDIAPDLAKHFVFFTGGLVKSSFRERVQALNQPVIDKSDRGAIGQLYEALNRKLV